MTKHTFVSVILVCGLGWSGKSSFINSGSSAYRVEFTGSPGAKLYGTTGWTDLNNSKNPMHMDKAEGTLPLSVSLNPPSGAAVSASAVNTGEGDVTIKIFHNGVECGENPFSGTAGLNLKVCEP